MPSELGLVLGASAVLKPGVLLGQRWVGTAPGLQELLSSRSGLGCGARPPLLVVALSDVGETAPASLCQTEGWLCWALQRRGLASLPRVSLGVSWGEWELVTSELEGSGVTSSPGSALTSPRPHWAALGGSLFFKCPSFLFSFVPLTENTSDSSSTTPHFPPPVRVCSPPLSLGSCFYFFLLAHGNLFSLDHQVSVYVNNCRAAPWGRRAEVTATHSLTYNLLSTPPTPAPLPSPSAGRGKQCQPPPGFCPAARPIPASGYSTRRHPASQPAGGVLRAASSSLLSSWAGRACSGSVEKSSFSGWLSAQGGRELCRL